MKTPHFSLLIVLISSIGLLSPLAHAKKQPDWIDGPSKEYPSKEYFLGVGAASTEKGVLSQQRELAENRARAEIAKIFQVEVQTRTEEFTQLSSERPSGKKMNKTSYASFVDAISTATASVLESVQLTDHYTHTKDKTLYALAVLHRPKGMALVQRHRDQAKSRAASKTEAANEAVNSGNIFLALKYLNEALKHSREADAYSTEWAVLSPGGFTGHEWDSITVAIEDQIIKLSQKIRFQVAIGGSGEKIKRNVLKALTEAGYRLSTDPVSAEASFSYLLEGETDVVEKGDLYVGTYQALMAQASLDMTVKNLQNQEIVGQVNFAANGNGKTPEAATAEALRQLGNQIEKNLVLKLTGLGD